jgi:DNA-binding Lrp family transcriptional regulator
LDERIVEALQENGWLPFLQLARELGVSEATIRNRYQRLGEAGVLQVGVTNRWRSASTQALSSASASPARAEEES